MAGRHPWTSAGTPITGSSTDSSKAALSASSPEHRRWLAMNCQCSAPLLHYYHMHDRVSVFLSRHCCSCCRKSKSGWSLRISFRHALRLLLLDSSYFQPSFLILKFVYVYWSKYSDLLCKSKYSEIQNKTNNKNIRQLIYFIIFIYSLNFRFLSILVQLAYLESVELNTPFWKNLSSSRKIPKNGQKIINIITNYKTKYKKILKHEHKNMK